MFSRFDPLLASAVLGALALTACSGSPAIAVLGDSVKCSREQAFDLASPVFDGHRVRLRALRGETIGIQVFPKDARGKSRLTLPEGAARVDAFRVGSVRVEEPSTALYGPSRGAGNYPDVLFPVDRGTAVTGHAYFDIVVPVSATKGRYEGRLEDGLRSIPVILEVDDVAIDVTKDPLVWAFYHPKELARVHGVPDDDGPAEIAVERRYHEQLRAHGVLFATNLGPSRFPARAEFVRDVRYWPVSVDFHDTLALKRDVARWLELFRDRPVTPFTIPIDEPRSPEARARAKRVADEIGAAGGGAPRLLRAVTDKASPLYGSSIDAYFSPDDIPHAAQAARGAGTVFWTYNGRPPQAGSMIIDTDGAALRTWGWIAFRYGLDLWYAWEAAYFSDRYNGGGPTDVFADPVTFDERSRGGPDFGNGDGLLVYPGPLPSLRLKALRRGLTDRQLLITLSRCGGAAEASDLARRMVPRALGEAGDEPSWPTGEVAWERARGELLDAIARRCHDPA